MSDEQPTNPPLFNQRMLRFEEDIVAAQHEAEAALPPSEEEVPAEVTPEEQAAAAPAETAPGLDDVHVVWVTVHIPRLTHKIQGLEQKVNGTDLSNDYTTGSSWKLMPEVHKKKLQNFDSEVRAILGDFNQGLRTRPTSEVSGSTTWDASARNSSRTLTPQRYYLKGLSLVADGRIDELVAELSRVHSEMRDYVRNEITADMDAFREEVREKLSPEAYEQARRHIPNPHELLQKTGVEWLLIPIAVGNTEIRDALRPYMAEFYRAIAESKFAGPREELTKALTEFEGLIQRDGQVTARSPVAVKRAVEKLRSFGELGDSELDRLIREMELKFQENGLFEGLRAARSSEHTSVASAAEHNGLSQVIRAVRAEAAEEVENFQRHGRMPRGLMFNGGDNGQNESENQRTEEEVPVQ